jgi:hypothetical protein
MSTPIGSKGRAWAAAATLLAAGALAAGCSTASSSSGTASGTPAGTGSSSAGGSPSGGTATAGPTSGPSTPVPASTPVPTVSGKAVAPGEVACAGWPSSAPTGSLSVSFVPVTVERCVSSAQTIPGRGLWSTATLERADSGLAALVTALRQPSATHHSGICPAIAMIPPAVVLISASGQRLIPKLPVDGCALINSQVTLALNGLHWTQVSVTLVSPISGGSAPTTTGAETVTGSPHGLQSVGATP